jgi:pyochelin synthetase
LQHPNVHEATTVLRSVGSQHSHLVSYVVMKGSQAYSHEDLRTFLAVQLPEAIVPRTIVSLDQLPRTMTGKIDRPALIAMDISTVNLVVRKNSAAPQTEMEQLVAKCWREVLRLSEVGVEEDFFEIGGDSLQAIQMVWLVQRNLPVRLPLGALFFQDPSLKGFAAAIEASLADEESKGSESCSSA